MPDGHKTQFDCCKCIHLCDLRLFKRHLSFGCVRACIIVGSCSSGLLWAAADKPQWNALCSHDNGVVGYPLKLTLWTHTCFTSWGCMFSSSPLKLASYGCTCSSHWCTCLSAFKLTSHWCTRFQAHLGLQTGCSGLVIKLRCGSCT